jgi:hypothetical protein
MPPLVGHRHRPGESPLYADTCLGLLLCHDMGFYLLIGVGFCLLYMWWPLNCKGSFLLGRGSWIVERVSSSHGRKDSLPLHVLGEECAEHDSNHHRADAAKRDFFA